MAIEYDEFKRLLTRRERGLDFARAERVFDNRHITVEDDRYDYGETRYRTIGHLGRVLVVLIWTPRGDARRIISMRRCDVDERTWYFEHVDRPG